MITFVLLVMFLFILSSCNLISYDIIHSSPEIQNQDQKEIYLLQILILYILKCIFTYRHTHIYEEIYCNKLDHVILETENTQDL